MIINNLFDLDFYKLTMAQYAFEHGKNVWIKYEFKDRTYNSKLFEVVDLDSLEEDFNLMRNLSFNGIGKLRNLNIFSDEFLNFLESVGTKNKLPPVRISKINGNISISVEGFWPLAIFWETYILSVINERYCANKRIKAFNEYQTPLDFFYEVGEDRLQRKISFIKENAGYDIKIAEFGTRRRFSKYWQGKVLQKLFENDITNLTSNVELALDYGYKPFGTFAHELPMIVSGIHGKRSDAALYDSQNVAFDTWYDMYNGKIPSIALSDTFTTEHTFKTFGKDRAEKWDGFRHDSGDPFAFADKLLQKYKEWGIDAKTKTIVFSDNLTAPLIVSLYQKYCNDVNMIFGWGTNLTNDILAENLSIVVKATEVNGVPIVKLSDNPQKISGDPTAVQRYKKVFIYE